MDGNYYELVVYAIDHNQIDIVQFDDDTLFMNIYYY